MTEVRVQRGLGPTDRDAVVSFLREVEALDGDTLDDHLQADLQSTDEADDPVPFTAATARDTAGRVVGYAQASVANDGHVVDSVVRPGDTDEGELLREQLLHAVLAELPPHSSVTWWTHESARSTALARSLGLVPGRQLLQMRRPLPIDGTADVTVRPFDPARDEHEWLDVNNAAFAWHGEQGGWDLTRLRRRERAPWFRPEGFLLHHVDDRLAAFCWTKLHPAHDHTMVGEIYVIAVLPDFHGRGLGKALTIAGLQWLHRAGATEAMLYVDAANTAAVAMYRALGFRVTHTNQSYVRTHSDDEHATTGGTAA